MAKPSWISVSPTNGQNNGSFDVTAQGNGINPAREGIITVAGGGQHSAEINVDIGPTLMMVYPGIGTGSTNFIFQFNIDIDKIALGMSDMSDKSPYINGRINASDPTQVMLNLGNGYPEISNAKLIITVKANNQTMNIYYTNKVDA